MQDFFEENVRELDPKSLMLIVVGAHLEAELTDRALAYDLRESILAWQHVVPVGGRLRPVVISDLWYLNTQPLRLRPAVTIGPPEVNAATAYLGTRVPTAFVLEETFRILLDPEHVTVNACVWGASPRATARAVTFFVERYLDEYLKNVHEVSTTP